MATSLALRVEQRRLAQRNGTGIGLAVERFGWPDSGAIRRLAQRNGTGIGIREIPVGFGRYRILLLYLERAPSKWAGTSLGI